jgi:hypothetical protein
MTASLPSGRQTDLAKEAIQRAQAEIVRAMATSKASIEAAVRQTTSVPGSSDLQDGSLKSIEQVMQAQQTAIQAAQDQALQAITASVAKYLATEGGSPPLESGQS